MNSKSGLKICVIGLGSMGFGVAATLLHDGFDIVGFDVSADAMARFSALGGKTADSLSAAAKGADVAICLVVNAAQTETVLYSAAGAAAAMAAGGTILSCATMSPGAARDFAVRAESLGLNYVDAPVSGGATRAASGELTIMASGAPAAIAHARPVLDCIAAKVYDLGEKAGTGAAFKIVNQLLAGVHIAAACEAITFAKAMDLDIARVYEVITASAGSSWMFENRVPHILDGDYAPRSAVDIFTKDLGIVADMGREMKFPTPIASMALQMFVMTAAAGMGRDDDASVARMIAGIAGLQLPGMEG
jgi:L-threonate 2-dehydrogenase